MPQYILSRHYVLPGSARVVDPGEAVELTEAEADRLMVYEPGLLKPALVRTQGAPIEIRAEETAEEIPAKHPGFLSRVIDAVEEL